MPPDTLDHQLSPEVLIELDQLGSTSELAAPLTIREDAEVAASSNDAGPSDPTFLTADSFDLLPVTLVHDTVGHPNLGDSLDVVSNLGVTPESEEDKLFRLSVLFLNSLPPSLTQYSEKPSSFSGDGPTVRIQPVTKQTRCYRKG
jgi:hypothetical protein